MGTYDQLYTDLFADPINCPACVLCRRTIGWPRTTPVEFTMLQQDILDVYLVFNGEVFVLLVFVDHLLEVHQLSLFSDRQISILAVSHIA